MFYAIIYVLEILTKNVSFLVMFGVVDTYVAVASLYDSLG